MAKANGTIPPVAVLVRRGARVESQHRVAYAAADRDGRLLAATGDVDRELFPRSAIKPLQALALIESGAADRFAVSERELALACASHSGEPEHVALVRAWLARLGLDPSALECGAHAPQHGASAQRLIAEVVRDMAGVAALPAPAIDGCGVPTWPIPLGRLAAALARFAHPVGLPARRADACARLQAAIMAHPH